MQFITHDNGRRSYTEGVREALLGGCRWIQLRMKHAGDEEFISTGRDVAAMCKAAGATFILDDRVHLVAGLEADGVHLGKNDMPPAEARRLLGPDKIIGATANTLDDMLAAAAGVDYIGLGPFRFTTTKERLSPVLGTEGYRRLMKSFRRHSSLPVVAIGGITAADIPDIMNSGVTGIALSGALLNATDMVEETKRITQILKQYE